MNFLNEKNNFLDSGFAILRNFISKSEIDKLVEEVDRVKKLANLNKYRDYHLINGRISSMHNLAEYSDIINFLFRTPLSKISFNLYMGTVVRKFLIPLFLQSQDMMDLKQKHIRITRTFVWSLQK